CRVANPTPRPKMARSPSNEQTTITKGVCWTISTPTGLVAAMVLMPRMCDRQGCCLTTFPSRSGGVRPVDGPSDGLLRGDAIRGSPPVRGGLHDLEPGAGMVTGEATPLDCGEKAGGEAAVDLPGGGQQDGVPHLGTRAARRRFGIHAAPMR